MAMVHQIELGELLAGWERWRCTADSCPEEFLNVARRSRSEDLWLIHERPGWMMAASVPVCPGCGTSMRKA